MGYIVVFRNPANQQIHVLRTAGEGDDDVGYVAEYTPPEVAETFASRNSACDAWGYEVVEVSDP